MKIVYINVRDIKSKDFGENKKLTKAKIELNV